MLLWRSSGEDSHWSTELPVTVLLSWLVAALVEDSHPVQCQRCGNHSPLSSTAHNPRALLFRNTSARLPCRSAYFTGASGLRHSCKTALIIISVAGNHHWPFHGARNKPIYWGFSDVPVLFWSKFLSWALSYGVDYASPFQ
jgi:hypothetical protein